MFADQSLEQKNEITVLVVNWLRCLVSPKNYLLCKRLIIILCSNIILAAKQPQHLPCFMMRKTIKQNTFCLLDWHLQTLLNKQIVWSRWRPNDWVTNCLEILNICKSKELSGVSAFQIHIWVYHHTYWTNVKLNEITMNYSKKHLLISLISST